MDVNKELKEEEESNPEGGEATRAYSIFPSDKRREREKKETLISEVFFSELGR